MLNVTGIGMVSSLGLDVVTSCAAARAGIVRAQELDVQIVDRETQDLVPVVGHVIPLTQGFTHTGRLLRIAQLALADLQRLNDWTSEDPERLLTYFVLPPADRAWQPLRYPPDPAVAYVNCRQSQRNKYPPDNELIVALGQSVGFRFQPASTHVVTASNTGLIEVLGACGDALQRGRYECALVLTVDSLIEAPLIQHLLDDGRLKCADNPVGLQPGEAGVAVLLQTGPSRSEKRRPQAHIMGYCLADEAGHDFSQQPASGKGLAEAVLSLHTSLDDGIRTHWILSDFNGETRRAEDFGHALVRLVRLLPAFQQCQVTYPATSFGDTQVASPGQALAWVVRAFARGYAPASEALILASTNEGRRAALAVRAGNPVDK